MKVKLPALLLLILLLVQLQAYEIEGKWLSKTHKNAIATITPYLTDQDGNNIYEMSIKGCSFMYRFKIIESFLKMTSLPSKANGDSCSSVDSDNLMFELA